MFNLAAANLQSKEKYKDLFYHSVHEFVHTMWFVNSAGRILLYGPLRLAKFNKFDQH